MVTRVELYQRKLCTLLFEFRISCVLLAADLCRALRKLLLPFKLSPTVPIGLRLRAKRHFDGKGRDIYWTDGDETEHPMIALSVYRPSQESDVEGATWYELYQTEKGSYLHEGLKMSDLELNLWLQGWNLDQIEHLEHKGFPPA